MRTLDTFGVSPAPSAAGPSRSPSPLITFESPALTGDLELGPLPSPGAGYAGNGRRGTYGVARFSTLASSLPAMTPSPASVTTASGGGRGIGRMSLAPGQLAPWPAADLEALAASVTPEVRHGVGARAGAAAGDASV